MTMRARRLTSRTIFHILVCAFGFLMLYPLLWMLSSSFKENATIFRTSHQLIPNPWTLDNYPRGWKGFAGIGFDTFFKNSFYVTIFSSAAQVLSSSWIAYGFARLRFRGRNFWFVLMMLGMMLPSQVVMIPRFLIFNAIGWVGTFLPLTWPSLLGSAFFVFLNMQFMGGIPRELDEAAKIDGFSPYGIYFRILLPLTSAPSKIPSGRHKHHEPKKLTEQ